MTHRSYPLPSLPTVSIALPFTSLPALTMYPFPCDHDTDFISPSLDPTTGVLSKDVTIDPGNNVTARLFLPISTIQNNPIKKKLPVFVYYHGGSFTQYSPFCSDYHDYLNSVVSQANVLGVSVDYRLAPKYLLPAAYDDSWTALKWVASHSIGGGPDPWLSEHGDFDLIFIAGDSAGANICHQLALRIGAEGLGFGIDKIEGMVLVDTYFWGTKLIESEVRVPYYEELWRTINSPEVGMNLDHPWLNPFVDGAPSLKRIRCERVLVCVAEKDGLALRGKAYCKALKESGWDGEVELLESKGKGHDFHLHEPECEQALELMKKLVAFLNKEEEEEKEVKGDGFFEGLYFWLLGDRLAKGEPVKIADQGFKEPTPMQWVVAHSCLFSCIEPLMEHGFLGYKRLF